MASKWFKRVPPHTTRHQCQLYCFPYAGGNTTFYQNWINGLPNSVELVLAQLPGRTNRFVEPALTDMKQVVEQLRIHFKPAPSIPIVFFGHSMGALLAFELARVLRRHHQTGPVCLFVSGCEAPQLKHMKKISHLPHDEFIEELKVYQGTPHEVLENEELMELVLPTIRADFHSVETYHYIEEPPLNCPIFAFGGWNDHKVDEPELKAWQQQTSLHFQYQMFEGDHFFLHPYEKDILQTLSQQLPQYY